MIVALDEYYDKQNRAADNLYKAVMKAKQEGREYYRDMLDDRYYMAYGILMGKCSANGYHVRATEDGIITITFRPQYIGKKYKVFNGSNLIHSKEVIVKKAEEAFSNGSEVFVYKFKDTYTEKA